MLGAPNGHHLRETAVHGSGMCEALHGFTSFVKSGDLFPPRPSPPVHNSSVLPQPLEVVERMSCLLLAAWPTGLGGTRLQSASLWGGVGGGDEPHQSHSGHESPLSSIRFRNRVLPAACF